jgi:hypothetical protein
MLASEAQDVTGMIGPAAELRYPRSAPVVPADAGPTAPSSIAAAIGTTSPSRGHARSHRSIGSSLLTKTRATLVARTGGGAVLADAHPGGECLDRVAAMTASKRGE